MHAHNASSPEYLRKLAVNRRWPTSPFMVIDLGAAMPVGDVTNMAKDSPHASADVLQNTLLDRFNLCGTKLRLRIE